MPGIMTLSNDSTKKTLFIAAALCLACSVVVSGAAVLLKPIQTSNKILDRKLNIVEVAGLMDGDKSVDEAFQLVETKIVDLQTGDYADAVDPATYDQRKAAKDPAMSTRVPADEDIASIKRKAKYAPVYLVRNPDGSLKTVILPVHGYGLWSTLYGFLALSPDTKTVQNLKFYEHAETPGLGGEVDNLRWRALWEGKVVYDDEWKPAIEIVKGTVEPGKPGSEYKVDGLAGATLTSRGVMYLLQYWLSEHGFGPYLERLRNERG